METVDKRRKNAGGGGPNAKSPRRKNKNGLNKGIKEEKISPVMGSDPSGVNCGDPHGDCSSTPNQSKGGLPDDLLLNGSDIKLENPSTPQLLDSKHSDCNSVSDIPPLSDLGHSDFPDCKPQMDPYCYPHYNNMPPSNSSIPPHPGDYGPPPPHMMGGYHQPPQPLHGPPPNATKQQPSTLEAQYMQQQNQIFVFSTKLANKAAEAVLQGQFPTIIAFHTSQAATRKFLECQGNPSWSTPPPPTGKMGKGAKNQQHQMPVMPGGGPNSNMPPDFMHQGHPPSSPCNMYNMNPKSSPQQPYSNYYDGPNMNMMGPGPMGPHSMGPGGPMGPHSMGHGGPMAPHCMGGGRPMGPGPGPMGQQPYFGNGPPDGSQSNRLTGVKIPDENLTPQQRHHREEQLAKLRKLQQVLIPDNEHPGTPPGDPNCHPIQPHENIDGYSMQPARPPSGPMGMDYNMHGSGGPLSNKQSSNNDWSPGPFFMDGPGMKQSGPIGSNGNGPRSVKGGGGSIPSPATPLTPGSSCGAAHRPSPHSPMSSDPLYSGSGGGHAFYPSGYYSPQVGQVQDNSPSGATVQRKDSESSNSDGGKSRKDKSSSSVSPNSSAPPSVKEANLMPVPSPQQIQYLHTFEGQELTIQKQPNMGLSDNPNDTSPGIPPSHLDMNPSTPNLSQQKPSHSAPPTPVSMNSVNQKSNADSMTSNTSSSKVRPGSVGPTTTPKSSTTPNPSPGMDRNSQPGTPLQMSMMEMKSSVTFSGGMNMPGNGPQGPCMMKQMPMSMESHTEVSSGVYDNVPLNPNLSGPPPPGSKPTFDPITSMVQMSQQLGGNGNSPNAPGGGSGGGYGMNPGGPPMNPNMVNFNTSMHNIQNVDGVGLGMGGPQTVNNTYVNATMTIQQMNIQNMPPYMNHGGPNMGPMSHQMGGMGQQMGQMQPMGGGPPGMGMNPGGPMVGPNTMPHGGQMGPNSMGSMGPGGPMPHNTMGHSASMGPHPGMGQNTMGQMGPNSMNPQGQMGPNSMGQQQMGSMGPMCGGRGPPPPQMYGNQPPQRLSGQGSRGAPYRLPNNPRAFGGTNIQVKPNAPNTIQYLPARPPPPHNQGQMCPQTGVMGPGPGPGPRAPPNLEFLQRYTNPSPGPVVNVNMGINVNVNMPGNRMPMPYPGGPPGPPPQGMVGGNGSSPCGGPMRGPNQGIMDQGHQGQGGQQLPPSMMGSGRGGGMKGPNDPVYAQQFHEFQRTLYATGTNNGRNPDMPPNMQNNPSTPPNQQFFK